MEAQRVKREEDRIKRLEDAEVSLQTDTHDSLIHKSRFQEQMEFTTR